VIGRSSDGKIVDIYRTYSLELSGRRPSARLESPHVDVRRDTDVLGEMTLYAAAMDVGSGPSAPLPPGKVPVALLGELLAQLPTPPAGVRLGPRIGEDACAIEVPGGVLVATTDPITLTTQQIGRFSVIVNANDVAVMGVRPRWFLAVILLPSGTTEATVREVFASIQGGLALVGATLVGGHTEVTQAVTQPLVVGQFLGLAEDGRFVSTGGVRPGDILIQVGLAPVEGAAVLAHEAADRLIGLDPAVVEAALHALDDPGISIVESALLASELGATALHDPTEGGLLAGLHEMAVASSLRIRADLGSVLWFEPGRELCASLGADPLATLASGSLLAAFSPDRTNAVLRALGQHGYSAARIGTAEPGAGVCDQEGQSLAWPSRDEVARVLSGGPERSG
jgi:hydrogenase maturation factor